MAFFQQVRGAAPLPPRKAIEIKQRFGPNAQLISSPRTTERKQYFEDLPDELQRVQLRQAGDVGAVIEAPGGFLLYVTEARTGIALTAACLSLRKRSYEQRFAEQAGNLK